MTALQKLPAGFKAENLYGRFCAVRRGLKWRVGALDHELQLVPNVSFWSRVNALKVAQSMHLAEQFGFRDGFEAHHLPDRSDEVPF